MHLRMSTVHFHGGQMMMQLTRTHGGQAQIHCIHRELHQDIHRELHQDIHRELHQDIHRELHQDIHRELHHESAHNNERGGLGLRPKKIYGERLGDGVEYHLMSPTPRR